MTKYKEEDAFMFRSLLDLYYETFVYFNGPIQQLFENNQDAFEFIVQDFTLQFEKYYFIRDCGKTLYNNVEFKGFLYCPLDKKPYLYV